MLSRRLAPLASTAALAALTLTGAPPARAEYKTTTSQALAAHAEWLPYAPPPPNGAAAVCLVDTGVDLNPDTASNVIARIALDGGDPSDLSDTKHGTQMAMVMGAPINGWGMVGFWPAVRIVSVRVPLTADGTVESVAYRNAIEACLNRADHFRIAVVALPLSGEEPPSEQDARRLDDALGRAAVMRVPVIAAAGNSRGLVGAPGNRAGVLATAAIDANGGLCPFSADGAKVAFYAIGCALDEADPSNGSPLAEGSGTSQAAVLTATLIASVLSYLPTIDGEQAVQYVSDQAMRRVDARGTFGRASLSGTVDAGLAQLNRPVLHGVARISATRTLPRPRVGPPKRSGRYLVVRVLNRPAEAKVIVRQRSSRRRLFSTRRSRIRIRPHRSVCISFLRRIESRARCLRSP